MSKKVARDTWLADEVAAGRIDTVALSFADRLGGWRGKRVPARGFVERESLTLGFCDGMIVCDIQCGVIEQTPFSNYLTGYPDLHVTFDPRFARPVGWRGGEAFVFGVPSNREGTALSVAPAVVLASVIDRLARRGVDAMIGTELSGAFYERNRKPVTVMNADGARNLNWLLLDALIESWIPVRSISPGFDAGSFVIGIEPMSPIELSEAVVVSKGAAKELARARGDEAVFMTRRQTGAQPALLQLDVFLQGAGRVEPDVLEGLFGEARPLLFPSVNAMRQMVAAPSIRRSLEGDCWRVIASAEADAATVLATVLAGFGAAMEGCIPSGQRIGNLSQSALLLEHEWLREWLGVSFLENSVPLFEHEASLFAAAVTDWEIDRYWGTS